MTQFLNTYLLSIVAIAALTVLTALGDTSATVTVPLIALAAGVHTGANLSNPTPVAVVTKPAPAVVAAVTPTTPTA